jgi:hypothetical protein
MKLQSVTYCASDVLKNGNWNAIAANKPSGHMNYTNPLAPKLNACCDVQKTVI